MNKYHTNRQSGQSLFEVVVALAISALVVVALVSLVSGSIRNATFSKNKSLASNYAQEAVEWLRGQRDSDVATFVTNSLTPTWCFANLDWNSPGVCGSNANIPGTPFTRVATFDVNVEGGKNIVEVSVDVSWTDAQGVHQIKNTTNFSDWRER